jgi:hypothetical protein
MCFVSIPRNRKPLTPEEIKSLRERTDLPDFLRLASFGGNDVVDDVAPEKSEEKAS